MFAFWECYLLNLKYQKQWLFIHAIQNLSILSLWDTLKADWFITAYNDHQGLTPKYVVHNILLFYILKQKEHWPIT